MIEVRRARPKDGAALGEIHATAWEASHAAFFQPEFAAHTVQSRRARWHERIAEGTRKILLAELDGRPMAPSSLLAFVGRAGDRG
jgi:hypothetical protein